MRLSWNEIRARAADFAREWADAHKVVLPPKQMDFSEAPPS